MTCPGNDQKNKHIGRREYTSRHAFSACYSWNSGCSSIAVLFQFMFLMSQFLSVCELAVGCATTDVIEVINNKRSKTEENAMEIMEGGNDS